MKTLKANLSEKSLDALIKALEAYKKDYYEKVEQFLEQLAEVARRSLQESFDEAVAMANASRDALGAKWGVNPIHVVVGNGDDPNTYIISASGQDVAFVEFGAGMYAGNPPNEFGSEMSIGIYPGSWSRYHERTWNKWIAKDKPKAEYPYNIVPANAFPKAYALMKNSIHPLARSIFGEGH